ncbi:DNA double-strand break repair nuclease NurA [Prochlorothrix hollandica]|uniref:Nuclease n=1 Tax=Prochlorothrix hollandica PCC 9006 = CALU 1027 TaxID=317619 RepID=A0A0M2PR37_PROHO|nr:DNA double-strand break repair nuclease NurA [Prochlorothrix hollandica]KKI98689.1 nuclease [Prochlorothrix hollandica PCC 9006 = CALU 1027]
MLDLTKLALQMQGISQHLAQEAIANRIRLDRAEQLLRLAQSRQGELLSLQTQWRDRLGFTAAEPVEPLNTRRPIAIPPRIQSVLATDGSQIAPSHHEIAYCYLLNIGRVVIHYGQGRHPLLDSVPEVVYQPEDLYVSRQWGISTEEWMGHRRTVAESLGLADLAETLELKGDSPPTLALTDGSLVYWFLEHLPGEARDRLLPPILAAWERLKALRVPLVGYLSASRSGEALNFLRLQSCPKDQPDCLTHCPGQTDQAPCRTFSPLRDATFWSTQLQPGERGPLWRSHAGILDLYGEDQTIYFCHVHGGVEVARVEFPAWVARDSALLDTSLSLTLAQIQKGYGYPVALAEAHNQAVVRGGDRQRFFALLEQQMIRAGLKNVGTSSKETRKRGSIA